MSKGALVVYTGPMFSGKTDALIADYLLAVADGRSAVAIKPEADTRHPEDVIVSHSGARIPARAVTGVEQIGELAGEAEKLFVDEVQFFDEELAEAVDALRQGGRHVVAAGLDLDFRREPFSVTAALLESATSARTFPARCGLCGRPAAFTQRLVAGSPAPLDAPSLFVGDHGLYEPRCDECWQRERLAARAAVPIGR